MTNEEAIAILQKEQDTWLDISNIDDAYWTAEQHIKAYQMAIEALEKQIPKKPRFDIVGGHIEFICPFCQCNYVNDKAFCDGCGQAIDWGEEDE